jgi:hypothetical protein
LDEIGSIGESAQLRGVAEDLERLGTKYGVDTRYEISRAEDKADEIEENEELRADSELEIWKDERYIEREEVQSIEDLFGNLISNDWTE